MLGRNGDAHVYMVRHQVPFHDLYSFCFARVWNTAPNCRRSWPKSHLLASLWERTQRPTCSPTWSGPGFGTDLTLTLLRVGRQATLRRILLPERSNLFQSHWSNQWLTTFS